MKKALYKITNEIYLISGRKDAAWQFKKPTKELFSLDSNSPIHITLLKLSIFLSVFLPCIIFWNDSQNCITNISLSTLSSPSCVTAEPTSLNHTISPKVIPFHFKGSSKTTSLIVASLQNSFPLGRTSYLTGLVLPHSSKRYKLARVLILKRRVLGSGNFYIV